MPTPIVDVVDRDNRPRGFSVDVNHATAYGQWFRGVHLVVYTADGQVLIERRSSSIIFHPDELDISLGGIVDVGEAPEHTALRELYEEVGIVAQPEQLELISVNRYNRHWLRYHKTTRNIMYHYLVRIPDASSPMQLQRSEVADAEFVSLAQARRLVARHKLARLGRLEPKYRMYAHLLDAVASRLAPTN